MKSKFQIGQRVKLVRDALPGEGHTGVGEGAELMLLGPGRGGMDWMASVIAGTCPGEIGEVWEWQIEPLEYSKESGSALKAHA